MKRLSRTLPAVLAAIPAFALAVADAQRGKPSQELKLDETRGAVAELDRVVITGMSPIPDVGEGAPRYTSTDLETLKGVLRDAQVQAERDIRRCTGHTPISGSMMCQSSIAVGAMSLGCEIERARKAINLADKAADATRAAEAARRDVAAGRADVSVAETAELGRQAAVREMERARARLVETQNEIADWQDLKLRGRKNIDGLDVMMLSVAREQKGHDIFAAPDELPPGLRVASVRAEERKDSKGTFTVVFGDIVNDGSKAAKIPDLSGALIDDHGWVLHKTVVSPDRKTRIQPGGSYPFGFEVRPAADAAAQAVVSFASKKAPPPRVRMNGFLCNRIPALPSADAGSGMPNG